MQRQVGIVRVLVLAAAISAARGPGSRGDDTRLLEVAVPRSDRDAAVSLADMQAWVEWLSVRGYAVDRCGVNPHNGTLAVDVTSDNQRNQLLEAGFRIVAERDAQPLQAGFRTQSQYFDPDEIEAMLAQAAADHPAITNLFVLGKSFEGRNIYALEISNNPGVAEDEPAIQFNGQHHAREVATSHVVMDVVETLTNGYGSDPQITQWVDSYKTVCVPMVNPDGVRYVFDVNSLWRRNRQVYPGCTGVDLNRNYPYLWGPGCGSSGSCNDLYRGPSAASEKETQAMIGLANDYHFVMATSYHSYGRFIDYPYACSDGSPSERMPEHNVVDEMMHGVGDAIFDVDGITYTVFSPVPAGGVNGDDTSWYYAHEGSYSFIIEVGTSFEPAFSQVAGIVNRNRGGWQYMYDRLGQARIDVHVTSACTGQPLEAEVTLTDFAFDTGELPRSTFLPFGRWTFLVVGNQTYTVEASKPDYETQEVIVSVGDVPESVEIALPCLGSPPAQPVLAAAPHDVPKNRYLSFDPVKSENDGRDIAFAVTLLELTQGSCSATGAPCRLDHGSDDCGECSQTGSPCISAAVDCMPPPPTQTCEPTGDTCVNDQAGSIGMTWWVGAETAPGTGVHRLVSETFRQVSDDWAAVVHVGDCEVVPRATYGVRAVDMSSGEQSTDLTLGTIPRPGTNYWADAVGSLQAVCSLSLTPCMDSSECSGGESCGIYPGPDGVTNFDDVGAAVKAFQKVPGTVWPDTTWMDIHGDDFGDASIDPPNFVINFADIQPMVMAFQGYPYPFSDPGDCP